MFRLEHIYKSFGDHPVLQDISLKVNKGDIYGVLGLSGAGKSTLVRCINGLEKFDKGELYYKGEKVEFTRVYKRKVTMIFQQFNLLQQRSVLKNVELAGELIKDKDRTSKAKELLKLVGLEDKFDSYPSQLSGGQQQRVAIARALMTEPEVLLCDEATSALDVATERRVLRNIITSKPNKTCIVTTHRPSVLNMCKRVYRVMDTRVTELTEEESAKMAMDF